MIQPKKLLNNFSQQLVIIFNPNLNVCLLFIFSADASEGEVHVLSREFTVLA
jgi:hypothetical protein